MRRYAVLGTGGCAKGLMPLARRQLARSGASEPWELVFVDDNVQAPSLNGMRVMHYSEWLAQPGGSRHIHIAVADGRVRERLAERCALDGALFFDIRADNIVVMDDVDIGTGAALSPFVTLTSNIRIGRHFQANLYSYVEHDCVIGDYVTFAPGVRCNGNVIVEDYAYIGSGAILRQGRTGAPLVIGRGAVIGMGAVVTRSVPPGVTVAGNPARELHSRPEGAAPSSET
jgi:sugar O-acyltransferase (sialic acid O-acetyltransferase NeuD family)